MKRILSIFLLLSACIAAQSQTKNFIDQSYVEVNGNADTAITPDEIYIRIILSESDTKNKTSVEELEVKMVDVLKALGINTEKDLTASDVGSNFKYYLLKSKDVLKTKRYVLKVSDAVTATKVVGKLEDIDISNTSVERVDYSKMEELKNDLRTKAVENAKGKAAALTKPLNQNLGATIYIGEIANNDFNVIRGTQLNEVVVTGYGIGRKQAPTQLPNIDFEKIKVTMTVNVKFILK